MKNILIGIILISCVGCSLLNIFPNPQRDKWYMEHAKDTSKLYLIREGMTRDDILNKWGHPWKAKNENLWVYWFSDLVREKTYVQFEGDTITKMWTSLW